MSRRSVYERAPSLQRPPRDATWVVNPRTARIVGWLGEDGEVVPLPPCCDDPLSCGSERCWQPFGQGHAPDRSRTRF